jgi:recombinational DNA repair ATPase RecF
MSSPKIRRISIRNLRRVQALDLSFVAPNDKPVSQFVIAGPNGSGKTTVLEAILFALGRDDLLKRDSDQGFRPAPVWKSSLSVMAGVKRMNVATLSVSALSVRARTCGSQELP